MQDVYAETVSAINFQNGIVRMILVDQDPVQLMKPGAMREEMEPRLKQQILMPLPGFLYMLSVIKNLMDDPKMLSVIERYADLGLIPEAKRQASADTERTGAAA